MRLRALRRWAGWQTPAVQALLLQALACLPVYLLSLFWFDLTRTQFSLGHAALAQGVLAGLMTAALRLARWWIAIQLLFPLALLVTLALQLPPFLFLAIFLFLLALYWSTFRTQVPFYPSGPAVWRAVLDFLPEGTPLRVIDIGSGLGGLALHLAKNRPQIHVTGIELAPLPWLASRIRARLLSSRVRFLRGDYEALDFAQFDLVFAYLSPVAMAGLWQKAQCEMRPGTLLLSYEFSIIGQVPDITVLPYPQGPVLYGWRQ